MRLPHTIIEKIPADPDIEWSAFGRPYAALYYPHTVSASTSIGFASPSLRIDLLPEVSALSLPVSHPGSRLLKLSQQNLGLSLTLCAASVWPFVALCQPLCLGYWITLCLSLLMIFDWENLSPNVIPADAAILYYIVFLLISKLIYTKKNLIVGVTSRRRRGSRWNDLSHWLSSNLSHWISMRRLFKEVWGSFGRHTELIT